MSLSLASRLLRHLRSLTLIRLWKRLLAASASGESQKFGRFEIKMAINQSLLVAAMVTLTIFLLTGVAITLILIPTSDANAPGNTTVPMEKTESENVTRNISSLVAELWRIDSRVRITDVALNLQARVNTTNKEDRSPERLFLSDIDITSLGRTFVLCAAIFDNYNATTQILETYTAEESKEIDDFLDLVIETDVMKVTHKFLADKGTVPDNTESFRALLYKAWFEPYPRSPKYKDADSSGFEHIFVGETRGTKSLGFHNWLHLYLSEKEGSLDYYGYLSQPQPHLLNIQFTWQGRFKAQSSMFLGTSPEFEMAVYTVCLFLHPGRHCRFTLDGAELSVQTWDVEHAAGLQFGSAYVVL